MMQNILIIMARCNTSRRKGSEHKSTVISAHVLLDSQGSAGPAGESPGNQETSRWDPASHADNQPWITFLTRALFIRNLCISYNKWHLFSNALLLA